MKRGRSYLRWLMPVMAVGFLGFAQTTFAQDDDYQPNYNSGNYDNSGDYTSDEALIQPENDVNYNTFHDELSPYGTWRTYPGYGNVWVCNVAGFSPYNTGGHWAYTRFGWTWVSDYNWGWAPFHYGRWGYDNAFGYFWVPGYTWGPAWVSWRNGGDYYGWAPLSPGLSVGINVGVGIGAMSWTFLPHRYMGYRNSYNYYAPRQNNVTIIRNTTIINNTHVYNNNRFVTGPDRRQVERYSGQRIQQQNIYVTNNRSENGRGRDGGIQMYHPNVNRGVVNNDRNGFQNIQPNRAQDNVRQQPNSGNAIQNRTQQPDNGSNRWIDRFQQRRDDRLERRDDRNGNSALDDAQRRQNMQNMRDRMQNSNNDQRRQQLEQMRQQRNDQDDQQRQQQMQQRQQQMNDRREQMQQQMDQRRQQQDAQRQQQMQQQRNDQMQAQHQQMMQQRQEQMQQRQQQMNQQRQQMQQQRQQQFQQRSQNVSRPAMQQVGGGRGRRN